MWVRSMGWEDLEKEKAIYSSILAWRIHGQRKLAGYSLWESCEQVCPQQIHISDFMADFVEKIG